MAEGRPGPRRRLLLRAAMLGAAGRAGAEEGAMPNLHLYLMEGFARDRVVVALDGREVLALDGVTTSALTSAAATHPVPLPPSGRGVLSVSLPARGLAAEVAVDAAGAGTHVAVSVGPAGLETHVSRQPLGAM